MRGTLRSVSRRILMLDEWAVVHRVELGTLRKAGLRMAWWSYVVGVRLAEALVGSAVVALLAVWLLMAWRSLTG